MNNDLISREALKKAIHSSSLSSNREWLLMDLDEIIDNAPTVEEKSYAMGYQDGLEDVLDGIRPQGKWIYHSDDYIAFYTCDKCGSAGDIQDKFCRNCGANMRGENNG